MKTKAWVALGVLITIACTLLIGIKSREFSALEKRKEAEEAIYKKAASLNEDEKREAIKELDKFSSKFSDFSGINEVWYRVAGIYYDKKDYLKAKDVYQKIIHTYPGSEFISELQQKLWDTNMKIIFSPVMAKGDFIYEVKPGDTLDVIAKKFNTTVELIMKSNNLKNTLIVPKKRLKISNAKYSVIVDKSQNVITLKSGEEIIKTYNVSTGANDTTPLGTFVIEEKLPNPPWKGIPPEDPRNILGSRWMGFAAPFNTYGIHGTTDPKSIGGYVTAGCIRMANPDVEELYMLLPKGTEVLIVD